MLRLTVMQTLKLNGPSVSKIQLVKILQPTGELVCILGVHDKTKSLLFCSLQGLNLSIFALSTGVEKDAIEEDQAFGHLGKISHSHLAM